MLHNLSHLFIPRESNNYKAKLLHHSGILVLISLLITFQGFVNLLPKISPSVLGYAANISPDDVVRLTNEKRIQAGLSPLSHNSVLSSAAQAKAVHMIENDYWAHVAPDGTQPWKFFTDFSYKYKYAGENLARDFSNPNSAVEAWMNSPTHRDNMLSSKYREIGIGVVEGDLNGVDTTIIVQFFGTNYADSLPPAPVAQVQNVANIASPAPTLQPTSTPTLTPTPTPAPISSSTPFVEVITTPVPQTAVLEDQRVLISPFVTSKGVSLSIVGILLLVLVVDGVVVSRRRIARIGGRTFAHLAFLGMILTIAVILKAGRVI